MYKLVKFITEVRYKDFSTYYLFSKSRRTLVPIEIYNDENAITPSIYNCVNRILKAVGFSIIGIKIYRFSSNVFYTYVTIKKEGIELDVNLSFKDAIEISKETSSPIFIKENILQSCGIKITKDMVLKALRDKDCGGYLER